MHYTAIGAMSGVSYYQERRLRESGARWRAVIGAGLLVTSGGIHLDLYLTGYRSIPTIGWLFLLQIIAALALAVTVLVLIAWLVQRKILGQFVRWKWTWGAEVFAPPVAALGAAFALLTLACYLVALRFGLFGFHEVRTTAGIVAGIADVAAFAVLGSLAPRVSYALLPRDKRDNVTGGKWGGRSWFRASIAEQRRIRAVRAISGIAVIALAISVAVAH